MKKTYGYFMLLSPDDNKKLIPIIQDLSSKYVNGDIFIPHISVYGPVEADFVNAANALDQAVEKINDFKMRTEKIEYEDRWSRTLYIKLEPHDTLTKISKSLEDSFENKYDLEPHISLMYKDDMSKDKMQRIASSLDIPKSFQVISCGLVDPNIQGDNWHEYARWTIVYNKILN